MLSHRTAHNPADPYGPEREAMLEHQLRRRGIVMHRVLDAMRDVPRHLFVPHEYSDRAYDDEALPSLGHQTISQPYIVAIMTQELQLRPGLQVLELGTGTGYQTAILAYLVRPGGMVYTIERVPELAEFARHRLAAMQVENVRFFTGDGSRGWPAEEPFEGPRRRDSGGGGGGGGALFDRILITAGAPEVPKPVLEQLTEDGILVVPIGPTDSQTLVRVERVGSQWKTTPLLECRFVPLLGAHGWKAQD